MYEAADHQLLIGYSGLELLEVDFAVVVYVDLSEAFVDHLGYLIVVDGFPLRCQTRLEYIEYLIGCQCS